MKLPAILIAILCLSACSSPQERRQAEIMDRIEQQVKLPTGAEPLERYARTYAFKSRDRVSALYFLPDLANDEGCRIAKGYGPKSAGAVARLCPPPDGMKAGERRWFKDAEALPIIFDGGCGNIDIEFDLKTGSVIFAHCNGDA